MIIPVFKVSKKRFFIQYLTIFNLFKFRLSENALLLLVELLVIYNDCVSKLDTKNHEIICNKVFDSKEAIMSELNWKLNVYNRYYNELVKKGVIENGLLKQYICLDPFKDSVMTLTWDVN